MKTKNIFLTTLLLYSLLALHSCIDETLNVDPNRPSSVPTPALIVTAEKQLFDNVRGESASLRSSALFIQQLSQVTYTSQSRYDIPFSYSAGIWDGLYEAVNNLREIIHLNSDPSTRELVTASGAGRNATQIAISRILKSYAFLALTDLFGDVPYHSYGSDDADFEALQHDPENITPRYAPQEKIYADILNELKQAGDTLLRYPSEKTFGTADIIYGGDNHQWALFANSLRLRIATRLKEKNADLYLSHFTDALAKGVFTGNADNAIYRYAATSPNEAPYYRATVTANRRDFALSKPFIDLLKGENPQLPVADPRLSRYAAPNGDGEFVGLPYGLTEAESGYFPATSVSLPGTIYSAANYGEVLMEYAEVAFLLSEYNNWSRDDYERGVRASLERWGVSATEAEAYLSSLPPAGQQSVLNQKYIALFTQFLEGWSDYRRTGYPDFLIRKDDVIYSGLINGGQVTYIFNPLFGDGGVPSRIYYPVKEQSVNRENYQAAVANQGNDVIETKLWIFR